MSEAAEKRIAELEQEVRSAHEMLFAVLWASGEVVVDAVKAKEALFAGDKMIDARLGTSDEGRDIWIFDVKEIAEVE
jgi:hypothetical protein